MAQVQKKDRSSKRRNATKAESAESVSLLELTELKHSICQDFVIRLHDDRVPVSFYEDQAIQRNRPLFTGVGASQLDRNSIMDMETESQSLRDVARECVEAVKNVALTISANGYDKRKPPWPGTVYFEDVSSESSFEFMEIIVETALSHGSLKPDT